MRRLLAAALGLGLLPRRLWGSDSGAGTLGAALAAAVSFGLWHRSTMLQLAIVAVAVPASLWAAAPFAVDGRDPGWVAIDEVAGTLLAGVGLVGWPWAVAMLVARLADIFKVLPGVRSAERLPGAWGVTADDLVAGGYGLAAGWAAEILLRSM